MRIHIVAALVAAVALGACSKKNETTTASDTSTSGAGGYGSGSGVSSSAVPGSQADLSQNVGDRVFFETAHSDLTAEARATLQRQAAWLKQYPQVTVTVEGHCDERGTREYNLALGERRATAARNFLVASGVPASRVQTVSYGKERPAVTGSNESAWAQNRRDVTTVN